MITTHANGNNYIFTNGEVYVSSIVPNTTTIVTVQLDTNNLNDWEKEQYELANERSRSEALAEANYQFWLDSQDIPTIYLERNINPVEFSYSEAADAILDANLAKGFTVAYMEYEDESVLVTYVLHSNESDSFVRFKQA